MSDWQKATKQVFWREPIPNAHEWKYSGRTPQGGLSGGDDVYMCELCGTSTCEPSKAWRCEKGSTGKTEEVVVGKSEYWFDIKENAILGKDIVIKHPDQQYPKVITVVEFKKYYRKRSK
jgi:hypothetical protein